MEETILAPVTVLVRLKACGAVRVSRKSFLPNQHLGSILYCLSFRKDTYVFLSDMNF